MQFSTVNNMHTTSAPQKASEHIVLFGKTQKAASTPDEAADPDASKQGAPRERDFVDRILAAIDPLVNLAKKAMFYLGVCISTLSLSPIILQAHSRFGKDNPQSTTAERLQALRDLTAALARDQYNQNDPDKVIEPDIVNYHLYRSVLEKFPLIATDPKRPILPRLAANAGLSLKEVPSFDDIQTNLNTEEKRKIVTDRLEQLFKKAEAKLHAGPEASPPSATS